MLYIEISTFFNYPRNRYNYWIYYERIKGLINNGIKNLGEIS